MSDERDLDEWASAVMSGYDGVAEAYDADRDPEHEATLVESLAADLPEDARVLDAGCGGGRCWRRSPTSATPSASTSRTNSWRWPASGRPQRRSPAAT
ncbi:class I SAM-dependent methyltransferase [Halosimplex litoreum]|uniref:hypothetical protein n=1 Tax=Halosimplex litoreum TaxID=1198301 RepID=UPI001E54A6BE|nr:hypothetical protein [Halosimplex litoreum]